MSGHDTAVVLTEAEGDAEYDRLVRVNNLAVDFCNADETYDHVDQIEVTEGLHPCTRCRRYAEMANRLAVQPPQDDPQPDERKALIYELTRAAVVAHRGPNDTDASVMRLTARDLRGGYDLGGSNRRAAVARVLDVVADALDRAALAEPTPGNEP